MKIDVLRVIPIVAFLMAFFLPLHMGLSNLFLIFFFVSSGYLFIIKREYVPRNLSILIYTLLPFFILYVIGLFYSSPPFIGTKVIGRTISFILCPLLLLFHSKYTLQQIKTNLFNGIILGSVLSVCILLINNFINYFDTRPFLNFDEEIFGFYYTYHNFTSFLKFHPTYMGAFVLFSLVILLKQVLTVKTPRNFYKWVAIFLLSVGVLFINARIIFLLYAVLVIAGLGWGVFILSKQRKFLALLGTAFVLIALFFIGIKSLSQTFVVERFANELKWELSDQVNTTYNKKTAADSRIARWEQALKAISDKPAFGHGTYTEKETLANLYLKNGLNVSYINRYDAHNMYLSFGVEYGMIGIFMFLFFLISNFILSIKYRDLEYFYLFFMVGVLSCFESYLQNNAGITFIAFFSTVLIFSNRLPILKTGYAKV